MVQLPIVERELRLAARRPTTQWGRVGAAAVAIGLTIWSIFTHAGSSVWSSRTGRSTFVTLALIATVSAVSTALRLTAPSIAAEKREGTLGLLFLTDLKPYDVVFGKLAATMLNTFYRALAVVPVFAIPVLMGGVTLGDVVRLAAILMNTVFLAAAVGMFASTLSRNEKEASGSAWILLLGILGATPLAALLVNWLGGPRVMTGALLFLSPAFAFVFIFGPIGFSTAYFWVPLVAGQLCAWGCLALTCRIIPRVWQDRPATASQQTRNERFRDIVQGDSAARAERRRQMLAVNPIYWLNNRDRVVPWYPWFFLAALAGLAIWATVGLNARWNERGLVLGACWLLHVIFKTWISSQSACTFSADRDRGALELLLSTPLTTGDLLRGHWLGLRRLFAAPMGLFLAVEIVWIIYALLHGTDRGGYGGVYWACMYAANLVVFLVDLWALGWVALWFGARSRNSGEGASKAQFRVLTMPWACIVATSLMLMVLGLGPPPFFVWLFGWLALSISVDIMNVRRARSELHTFLRAAALYRAAGQIPAPRRWIARVARSLAGAVSGRA